MAVTIPGYDLRRLLGDGRSTLVYEAIEQRTGRTVAVKVWNRPLDAAAKSRIFKEARALMCVVHPNVVQVIDYAAADAAEPFVAMELCEGQSLDAVIDERKRLPEQVAASIFAQVFAGMSAAHAQGVLHRGFSAASVILTQSGRAVVTDFGLGLRVGDDEAADVRSAAECMRIAFGGAGAKFASVAPKAAEVARDLSAWLEQRKIEPEQAIRAWLAPDTQIKQVAQTQDMGDSFSALRVASGGRFEVRGLIGQGGMARVFRAVDTRLKRDVAIKLMNEGADATMRRRFHREARALGRVRHPNVIEVIDYSGADAALPYIVLELIEGHTLEAAVNGRVMPEQAALATALSVCEGLEAVHREGFVHRDVKPENVFVDPQGRVVLADFGIVRSAQGETTGTFVARPTSSMGSPLFASPEQIFAPDSIGPRSDLFSLGSLLFYLLTGTPPVAATTVVDALTELMEGKLVRLEQRFSGDVRALVSRLHQRDPNKRPESAAEVATELRRMLAERQVVDERDELRRFINGESGSFATMTEVTGKAASVKTEVVAKTDVVAKTEVVAKAERESKTEIVTQTELASHTEVTKTDPKKKAGGTSILRRTNVITQPAQQPERSSRRALVIAAAAIAVTLCAAVFGLRKRPAATTGTSEPEVLPPPEPIGELPEPKPAELAEPKPTVIGEPPPAHRELQKHDSDQAVVRFFTKPWAKITIDGKLYGTTPIFNTVELPPGRHVMRFENPAYVAAEKKIDLRAGERREIHVTLEKP
jgi:serine/threonine-protein kinase